MAAKKPPRVFTKEELEKFKDLRGQIVNVDDFVIYTRWYGQSIGRVVRRSLNKYKWPRVTIECILPANQSSRKYGCSNMRKLVVVNELRGLV